MTRGQGWLDPASFATCVHPCWDEAPPCPIPSAIPGALEGSGAITPPCAISHQLLPSHCPILPPPCHHPSRPRPGSPLWLPLSSPVPPGDRSDPEGKAKSAKSTKKEPMSMFQVNGEKKEKKSKKKGMG